MGLVSVELPCLTGFCLVVTICFAAGGTSAKSSFCTKRQNVKNVYFLKQFFLRLLPSQIFFFFYIQYTLFRGKNVDVWKPMTVHLALRSALCLQPPD